jgi:hypothetical protein
LKPHAALNFLPPNKPEKHPITLETPDMHPSTPFAAALLTLCMSSAPALAAPAHVHGQATLTVAVDGGTLTLMLESPTDSLVGFEHATGNAQERAAVAAMKQTLEQASKLFLPTPTAACKQTRVKLASPLLGSAPEPGHEGHADLDGEFVFQCAQPQHLHDLDVRLFERFPRIKKLNVEVAGPNGQKAVQLSATQNKVSW